MMLSSYHYNLAQTKYNFDTIFTFEDPMFQSYVTDHENFKGMCLPLNLEKYLPKPSDVFNR
jgi:hypothetical protein